MRIPQETPLPQLPPDMRDALKDLGPEGVFLRFLWALTERQDLFHHTSVGLMGCGAPARVFVAADHWLFSSSREAAIEMLHLATSQSWARVVNWIAPGEPPCPKGWKMGTDVMFTGSGDAAESVSILSGNAVIEALDRVHPSLQDRIPPAPIRSSLPFQFHGLEIEGQLVALCDTTVHDDQWTVIQQVHTAPDFRRRGHAKALVTSVLSEIRRKGTQGVWVCDAENTPSIALATACGLTLQRRFSRLSLSSG